MYTHISTRMLASRLRSSPFSSASKLALWHSRTHAPSELPHRLLPSCLPLPQPWPWSPPPVRTTHTHQHHRKHVSIITHLNMQTSSHLQSFRWYFRATSPLFRATSPLPCGPCTVSCNLISLFIIVSLSVDDFKFTILSLYASLSLSTSI